MSHKPKIGLHLGFEFFLFFAGDAGIHIFLRAVADIGSPWFDIRSEEENSLFTRVQNNLSLMELESELVVEKVTNLHYHLFEYFPVRMEEYHIIHISTIIFHAEGVFHKVVECMQIKISEKLTHEVSEWQPPLGRCREETFMFRKFCIDYARKMCPRVMKKYYLEKVHKYSLSLSESSFQPSHELVE